MIVLRAAYEKRQELISELKSYDYETFAGPQELSKLTTKQLEDLLAQVKDAWQSAIEDYE